MEPTAQTSNPTEQIPSSPNPPPPPASEPASLPKVEGSPQSVPADQPETGYQPVRDLFSWTSPSRPPIVLTREMISSGVTICLLITVIFAFISDYWGIIPLCWAGFFMIIALSKRPPEEVEHKITTQGIISLGKVYLWENLGPFWFTQKTDYKLLHIVQQGYLFGTLVIVVPQTVEDEKIRDHLAKYLPFIEVLEKSRTEKFADWFTSKLSMPKK